MNKNQLRINIRIEGRMYPLVIDRNDEEKYRSAAKMVNETIAKYKDLYRDKDAQDIIAMAAFQVALEHTGLMQHQDKLLLMDELNDLNDDISDFIKERKSD